MDGDNRELTASVGRLGPFDELEMMDIGVKQAGIDEMKTMFDDDTHPKPPHAKEEGITDVEGTRSVDIMLDTPPIDPIGTFDLTADDLNDLDIK